MAKNNIFLETQKELLVADYLRFDNTGRGNLGEELPIVVYRLMEYSLREELRKRYGKDMQIEIFRSAGYRAGTYFVENKLDQNLPFPQFIAQLQNSLEELKIGILRIESLDEATGKIILTVSEDADCSGLPLLGETVCNYDEGFISGILSAYTGKEYEAMEVDCWATGDRVCRFCAEIQEKE